MWDRLSLEKLSSSVPPRVDVDWDKKPSVKKYGHVNALLAVLSTFDKSSASFLDHEGKPLSQLTIRPLHRKITDRQRRNFTIVGHGSCHPLLLLQADDLLFEVYFNNHLFVETETTFRQYYPSASVILRCRNFLWSKLVPSPGSWGSDIISITLDWKGTLILETCYKELTGHIRRNFRGYKLVPSTHKHFVTSRRPRKSELTFLKNNGFENVIVGETTEECVPRIEERIESYLTELHER